MSDPPSESLVPVSAAGMVPFTAEERERVQRYTTLANAESTIRSYRTAWAEWVEWCAGRGFDPLPAVPGAIAAFATEMADAGAAVATIQRKVAAIGRMHREAGIDPPPTRELAVQRAMQGIRRSLGVAPRGARKPLTTRELRRLLAAVPLDTLAGKRDRALLLIGFYSAGRRSEVVALDVADLEEDADGLRLTIRRSKTDQEGEGTLKGVPRKADADLCPVRTLAAWLVAAGITSGPIFRRFDRWGNLTADRLTDQSVALIVKRACTRAGVDPARYAGHSLRSGFATSAAAAQVAEASIMRQTGHRSALMVRRYVRHGSVFVDNAASYVNL